MAGSVQLLSIYTVMYGEVYFETIGFKSISAMLISLVTLVVPFGNSYSGGLWKINTVILESVIDTVPGW